MSNLYNNPNDFGLKKVEEIREKRVYDGYPYIWTVAVWQHTEEGGLYWGIDHKAGTSFDSPPFRGIESVDALHAIILRSDLRRFKFELNDYWTSRQSLTAAQRELARRRLQLEKKLERLIAG